MCNLKLIPVNNTLVEALSETAREQLQLTYLAQGAVMLEAGERPRYVHFPVGCIVSLLHSMVDGSAPQRNSSTPTMPSWPTTETCAALPSTIECSSETMQPPGKCT